MERKDKILIEDGELNGVLRSLAQRDSLLSYSQQFLNEGEYYFAWLVYQDEKSKEKSVSWRLMGWRELNLDLPITFKNQKWQEERVMLAVARVEILFEYVRICSIVSLVEKPQTHVLEICFNPPCHHDENEILIDGIKFLALFK